MYVCASAQGVQKSVLALLELEIQALPDKAEGN